MTDRALYFCKEWEGHDVTYWTDFANRLPAEFYGFDVISWDNDLGPNSEVYPWLRSMMFSDPKFAEQMQRTFHVIHSANPIASKQIAFLFQDIRARFVVKPINM